MTTPSIMRSLFLAKLKDEKQDPQREFHPQDLERLKDDNYLQRILQHQENDVERATNMLFNILAWRKSVGASEINESNINIEYLKEGIFFPHNRDVDGSVLFIIQFVIHFKGQKDMDEVKRVIIYWFDRIERVENGKKITLFFDMDGCSSENMDMELIKYLITLLKMYYPDFLNHIVIYQMPWILSSAFKVVKTLLPAKSAEKMIFVTKKSLKEVVSPDQALTSWGGQDDYIFEFVPENRSSTDYSVKKVNFAKQGDVQQCERLRLVPKNAIVFKIYKDEIFAQFVITNKDESAVSFKIRTTTPEKYRVRPCCGVLASGASQTVLIVVQPGFQLNSVTKDRFLVMCIPIARADISQKELTEVWQYSAIEVEEYKLSCQYTGQEFENNCKIPNGDYLNNPEPITTIMDCLQAKYDHLNRQINRVKTMQFISFMMICGVGLLAYLLYINMQEVRPYCDG